MITKSSSDTEVMAEFESLRRQACGEAIGEKDDTPTEAAEREGWTIVRQVYVGTSVPGRPVLAQDARGRLWLVNDLDGPWAIMLTED